MDRDLVAGSQWTYFICGTPRTASTLLCTLLKSTGVAGVPESYFREPDEAMWAARWSLASAGHGTNAYISFVRAAAGAATTSNGVTGFRIMWGTMERIASGLRGACGDTARTDLELLAFAFGPDLKFVHLRREDRIAQAVSWARAEQTGYWQVGDPRFAEPAYDFAVIDTYVRTIREHELAWRDWFTRFGVNVYEIEYERLVASPAGTVRALGDYLGVDLAVGAPITAADQRQADRINFEWARRFRLDGGEG